MIDPRAMRIMHKDCRRLAKVAHEQGWDVGVSGRGHISWRDSSGRLVTTSSSSPSDIHAIRNLERDLRRGGLDIMMHNEKQKPKVVNNDTNA